MVEYRKQPSIWALLATVALTLGLSWQPAQANPIFYELEDLGAGRFEYVYTLDNQTATPIDEFTIYFDLGLYANLTLTGNSQETWDGFVSEPDPNLPDDGFADWCASCFVALAPLASGAQLTGFAVSFDWLGSQTPGRQFFEIIDPLTFNATSTGFTQPLSTPPPQGVPSPGTLPLMLISVVVLLGSRRFRQLKLRLSFLPAGALALAAAALLGIHPVANAGVDDLEVTDRQLVSKKRVGRSHFDYTYTVTLVNSAGPLVEVVGDVTSSVASTQITQGQIAFGNIGPGSLQSTGTFTLRQNRRVLFNPADLSWSFSASEPSGGNNAPVITSTPTTQTVVNSTYTYQVNAIDADPDDVLTYQLLSAPVGMTIDATAGTIDYVAGSPGTVDVDIQVADLAGLTDRQLYQLQVSSEAGDLPPNLAPIANMTTAAGVSLMLIAQAVDPEGLPVRYGLSSAPRGMAINTATGELRWTPNAVDVGSASATVTATDPGGLSAATSFNIDVLAEAQNQPPLLAAVADRTVPAQTPIHIALQASDADANEILSFELAGGPVGLQFDGRTGQLDWIPTSANAGRNNLTATVTDSAGASASASFAITVLEPAQAPIANNDAYGIKRSETLTVPADGVLLNDVDANNDVLSTVQLTSPTFGNLQSFPGDGSLQYQPPAATPIELGLATKCSNRTGIFQNIYGTMIAADITGDGLPELVGMAPAVAGASRLIAYSPRTCELIRQQPGSGSSDPVFGSLNRNMELALADLDGDGDLEIVAQRNSDPAAPTDTRWLIFDHEFNFLFMTEPLTDLVRPKFFGGLNVVDLDADGTPEVVVAYVPTRNNTSSVVAAFSPTGALLWQNVQPGGARFSISSDTAPSFVDLDLDGTLEIVYQRYVISHDGTTEFLIDVPPVGTQFDAFSHAVANFDNDPFPEIITINTSVMTLYDHQGQQIWTQPVQSFGRGPITVADVDGDGEVEIVYVSTGRLVPTDGAHLWVYEKDGTFKWAHENLAWRTVFGNDTPVVAFDADGDGADELIVSYRDPTDIKQRIYLFDGSDGSLHDRAEVERNIADSHTIFPVVADLDDDGHAEIAYSGSDHGFHVLQGLPGNEFAPARPIRNQWAYSPTLVTTTGAIVSNPKPYWLQPGLNSVNAVPVVPGDPGSETIDQFSYQASDGSQTSNEATVSIRILPNVNGPTIASQPPLGASPGFDYRYASLTTDADAGDSFSYTLVDAPAGMVISNLGIITWQPAAADLGDARVLWVVTDNQGNTDSQEFTINVRAPVVVPNLLGQMEQGATDELQLAGLALGVVRTAYSLMEPAGGIISQSVAAGDNSAAGAFVDVTISLGPQPIFAPALVDLNEQVAIANMSSLGLAQGVITRVNSNTVLKGNVVAQSVGVGQQVPAGTSVDLTISSGPAAVLSLSHEFIAPGDNIDIALQFFDAAGDPAAVPADLLLDLAAEGYAAGGLPTVGNQRINTTADTRGGYKLSAISASRSIALTTDFIVTRDAANDGLHQPYAVFLGQLATANAITQDMQQALADGNPGAIPALAAQLTTIAVSVDTNALQATPPMVLETGFLPVTAPGTVNSVDDGTYPSSLGGVLARINDSQVFLERLTQGAGRNDDIRARQLNQNLAAAVDAYLAVTPSRRGYLVHRSALHQLLSVVSSRLLVTDINRTLAALAELGLLASSALPTEFYTATSTGLADAEDRQPTFFTVSGVLSASSIRMSIIQKFYLPSIRRIIGTAATLTDIALQTVDDEQADGIITAASLSLHIFNSPNSVYETRYGGEYPEEMRVKVFGPDFANGLLEFNAEMQAARTALTMRSRRQHLNAAIAALEAVDTASQRLPVDETIRGCVLSMHPDCGQLVFYDGYPAVHTIGSFPAPVLIQVERLSDQRVSSFVANFFPQPQP